MEDTKRARKVTDRSREIIECKEISRERDISSDRERSRDSRRERHHKRSSAVQKQFKVKESQGVYQRETHKSKSRTRREGETIRVRLCQSLDCGEECVRWETFWICQVIIISTVR